MLFRSSVCFTIVLAVNNHDYRAFVCLWFQYRRKYNDLPLFCLAVFSMTWNKLRYISLPEIYVNYKSRLLCFILLMSIAVFIVLKLPYFRIPCFLFQTAVSFSSMYSSYIRRIERFPSRYLKRIVNYKH